MTKSVVLLGDLGTDHAGFPPTPVIAGSPDVLIDGKPVARVGDPLAPHTKPKHSTHPRTIAAGSATVLINGIPAAVTGGAISCGGVTMGSGSVIIGDTHSPARFSGLSPRPVTQASRLAPSAKRAIANQTPEPQRALKHEALAESGRGGIAGSTAVSGLAAGRSDSPTQKASVEPGFHVVQRPMNRNALLAALYGDASAKPDSFDRLNPGLGDQVLPGEMIVLGDPEASACTLEEADLMAVAEQVNAKVRSLSADEAQFLIKHYDLLEVITSTSSAGLGAGAVMVAKQLDHIKATLMEVERLHQDSYRKHGHLNHSDFFEKRRALFKKLDFALGSLAKRGMSLDDDPKLKRALGLSSKSIVRHWNKAGVGNIPGYATHYERVAAGSKYVRGVGYLGIALDSSMSALKIREACRSGRGRECQAVTYQEGGKLVGTSVFGALGGTAAGACTMFAVTSAGIGGIACAILVGGVGAAVGASGGAQVGEASGELLRESIHEQ
ncbi:type VI secretion system PAAR protein [Marinobacter qingdaonensis]|uniref:Type VI secretion system PAAR protein n=1 Tax=Marinobacter qingdaonensis TaxID=3108486 RepID=A0ABU5NZ96_9GAMM|nr:type VI secretion system PAAR protein [Marinobacter sp. ASW11-75]MEA1081017.1 type VI secretion system PAAR protein [Marinobacter sp. ASW11-75]